MTRFNTGNNLNSLDERDFYDNCLSLDQAMNSTDPTWRDRFNVEKPTIDAALKSAGFMPAGFDFVTGGTLQPGDRNKAVYNPAPNGDNNWYRWNGAFPKEIAANSQPNPKDENNWVPVLIKTGVVEREALRRTYQEARYNLVEGSFEQGGVLVNVNDVLLQERTGKAFSGPAGVVAAGTNPASGGFVDMSAWPIASMQEFNAGAYGLHPSNTGLQNCKALQALSAAVKAANGGVVVFPPGTFIIGAQTFAGARGKGYAYKAEDLFRVKGVTGALVLKFNGTKFKWADGLRFGSFDPVTGEPINPTLPYYVLDSTSGLGSAIAIEDSGYVGIEGAVEIDGNDANLIIGGQWGDKGYQTGHSGIWLIRNKQVKTDGMVYTHHHLLDGFYCGSRQVPEGFTELNGIVSVYNGRQGLSITGGDNITINNSVLGYTSDGVIHNSPGFGVDIETEVAPIQGITFNSCYFPAGPGGGCVVSDNMSVRDAVFNDCVFESTGGPTLYMYLKGVKFNSCKFYGGLTPIKSGSNSYQQGGKPEFNNCFFSNMTRGGAKAARWPRAIDSAIATFNNCKANVYHESDNNAFAFWIDDSDINGFEIDITGILPTSGEWMLLRGVVSINRLKINNKTTSATEPTHAPYIALGTPVVSDTHLSLDASGHSTLRWGGAAGYPTMTGWLLAGDWAVANNDGFTKPPRSRQTHLSLARNMAALEAEETILVSSNRAGVNGKYYTRGTIIFNAAQSPGGIFGWVCTTTGNAGSTAVFKVITNIGA